MQPWVAPSTTKQNFLSLAEIPTTCGFPSLNGISAYSIDLAEDPVPS